MTERDKWEIRYYMHILNAFFREQKIWDDEIRSDLNLRFYQAYQNYDGFRISVEDYLKQSLRLGYRYFWIDRIRKDTRNKEIPFTDTGLDDRAIANLIDNHFTVNVEVEDNGGECIKEYYGFLSWKQQQLIYYRYYENMTYDDIADHMGTTKQNIQQMHERIADKMRSEVLFDFGSNDSVKALNVKTGKVRGKIT